MDFLETVRVGYASLQTNKMRTGLMILGMAIGVGAVITLMSIGQGAQAAVAAQFNSLGTNLVFATPGTTNSGGVRQQAGSVQTLTVDDATAIADPTNVPDAVAVSSETTTFGQIVEQAQNTNGAVYGVTDVYATVHNYQSALGSWISTQQAQSAATVVVLGASVAQTLFPGLNPVGQTVRIVTGGTRAADFQVMGVGRAKGGSGFNNPDTAVYIPLLTAIETLNRAVNGAGNEVVNQIVVKAASAQQISAVEQEISSLLLQRHNITNPAQADFSITSQQVTGVLTIFLGAVAGISLLVGGIGIMNIEIVSVTERTREIGIRKAIGARRWDIMEQFLVESVLLSLAGGLTGVIVGVGVAHLINGRQLSGQAVETLVTLPSILLALGVSAAIGVFFGLYPAMRAASMRPIEALRYE